MKKLLFWLCMMVNYAMAQPQITWLKQFGTYKSNTNSDQIVALTDTTYTLLANYQGKHKIIHLSALGDTLWTKSFATNFQAHSFIKTTDGGYAMLGNITGDDFLVKMDSLGDTLWSQTYPQLSYPRQLIQTTDGGYAISSYNGWDMIKTDALGNLEWQSSAASIHVQGILECYNRQYLVYGNSGFNPYCYKAALFDSLGILIWVNYYGNVTYLGADIESILSAVQ